MDKKLLPVEERRVFFRAELPQNKYLTSAPLIQVRLPDSSIGKERVTCCAPVLVEVDRELRSGSKAYLPTYLLLTSFVPIADLGASYLLTVLQCYQQAFRVTCKITSFGNMVVGKANVFERITFP